VRSIRRFKGMERPVVVLRVPRDDPDRLDRLLYIAASQARQHLVAIVPLAVVRRMTTLSSDGLGGRHPGRLGRSPAVPALAASYNHQG
jgi:hypothetical protein